MFMILLYVMAVFYVVAGVNHFRVPRTYIKLMPPWIPQHRAMVLASGTAEIAFGLLLIPVVTRPYAAWGIIAMLIVFFSVHIHMYQQRNTLFRKIPKLILIVRFPLQFVLIYWAYLYTAA